jgi:hypothetical protein
MRFNSRARRKSTRRNIISSIKPNKKRVLKLLKRQKILKLLLRR